ncbi:MAG: glycerol-3-phosphate 1-O-acyltransferase PlsY [Betaproteobacteria bacterium]|nr:glycerol-3-phosphate 1-O-acyltransferase PlsY [Betaproteobacteria bacterium]
MAIFAAFVVFGYLLGSLPFAVIVSRAFGLADPRSYGSGNPGATNVLRSGSKLAAVLTLLGDAAKGWLAVWLASRYLGDVSYAAAAVALTGLAAFLGHVFPLFLKFKGGKGVATALGVLLGFSGWLALAALAAWLLVALVTRYSSLAALVAALVAALAGWLLLADPLTAGCVSVLSLLLIWRHQSNIGKLRAGTESRIGRR